MTGSLELNEVLERVSHRSIEILGAEDCIIFNLDDDGFRLIPLISLNSEYQDQIFSADVTVDNSLTGNAIKQKHGIILNHSEASPNGYQIPGTPKEQTEHILSVPFVTDGEVSGAMCVSRPNLPFNENDLSLAETLAMYAAIALKNARLHHNLKYEIVERRQAQNKERKIATELAFLSQAAIQFVEPDTKIEIYKLITKDLLSCLDDGIVIMLSYSTHNNACIKSIECRGNYFNKFIQNLDHDPVGLYGDVNQSNLSVLLTGKLTIGCPVDKLDLSNSIRSRLITAANDIDCHSIGFAYDNELLASAILITPQDYKPNTGLINTYVNQASIALQRRRVEQELNNSEQRYRSIFQTTAAAILELNIEEAIKLIQISGFNDLKELIAHYHKNPDTRDQFLAMMKIVDCNNSAVKLFEAEDKTALLKLLNNNTRENNEKEILDAILTKLIAGREQFTAEVQIITVTNKRKHVLLHYTQPPDIETADHHLLSLTDVTELKHIQHKLQEYTRELERSNQELEQFAYAASHDLQEPLRMVSSYVRLIEKEYKNQLDEEADLMIDFAVDGAKRMQALINGLLQYSRVGTQGKKFTTVDCDQIITDVLKNLKLAIEENQAVIKYDKLPVITADDVQIAQVFQNLIGNAIKFRGELPPVIYISCRQTENYSFFSVRDDGIGIKSEHTARIFDLFQRLHTREKYPGTGIGLSICKRIIERHGGKISVKSKPDDGSEFTFSLPKNTELLKND